MVREEPATDAERQESVRALEQLKGRVPLMSAEQHPVGDRPPDSEGDGEALKSCPQSVCPKGASASSASEGRAAKYHHVYACDLWFCKQVY